VEVEMYIEREREMERVLGVKVWYGTRWKPYPAEPSILVVERSSKGMPAGRGRGMV